MIPAFQVNVTIAIVIRSGPRLAGLMIGSKIQIKNPNKGQNPVKEINAQNSHSLLYREPFISLFISTL